MALRQICSQRRRGHLSGGLFHERIKRLAEIFSARLGVERQRVLQFAYAHGGLSASWQLDEGQLPDRRRRIAALIESLL